MEFIADLHIHSAYSRATSKDMNLESLYRWAQLKGLAVVATGDFTHPRWFAEMQEKLEPAEPGLYKLKDSLCAPLDADIPESCRAGVRFILSAEVSTIYKKNDRTRKVHSVILSPDFAGAGRLNARLQDMGANITSDGRPIIGMDCKRLLEFALAASPDNVLIPAHIWTPHFSVLGAASGFDSIDECFEDLTPEIFALETGLSSDPAMNWTLSALDRFVLVSNSDAHSPAKLAREANIFACDMSYPSMMKSLRDKDQAGFKGTLEFFPEEGKYHLDGHRACNTRLTPQETRSHNGLCPVCGRKVTVGVMHRVSLLADRDAGARPPQAFGFESLIPLAEIIAEVHGMGVNTNRVRNDYEKLLVRYGSELSILRTCPTADLRAAGWELLAEAIDRVRRGQVDINPGYDGQYGAVGIVSAGERRVKQPALF